MGNNLYGFKRRFRPEWYKHGPVKIYTREEIEEWERNCDPRLWQKYNQELSITIKDRHFLDRLEASRAEVMMSDIMSGVSTESEESHDGT